MNNFSTTFLFMLCIFLFVGCSTRENAVSLKMADQSIEASIATLHAPELIAVLDGIEDHATSDVLNKQLTQVGKYLVQARDNIASPLNILADGKPIDMETSVSQALLQPELFLNLASKQATRAEIEAETFLSWNSTIDGFVGYIKGEQGFWAQLLMLLGMGSGTAGGLALVAQTLIKRAKVTYAEQAFVAEAAATPHGQLSQVKARHKSIQKSQGIHGAIVKRIENKKAPTIGLGAHQ
ncbi:MAG: hypothetical protein HRU15_20245 [Planctomycetes bacterium]|nr:hypothetical protein [Planctomycetota bacterium]